MAQVFPLYEGARPQSPQQQLQGVPAFPHVEGMGEALDNAVALGVRAVMEFSELHDFGVEQEEESRLRAVEDEMQREFDRRMELAPGAEKGFYNAERHLDEDALKEFATSWQQKNEQSARPFWLRKNAMRFEEGVRQFNEGLEGRVLLAAAGRENERRERVFRENFDEFLRRKDAAGAMGLLNRGLEVQQVDRQRALGMRRQVGCMTGRSAAAEACAAGPAEAYDFSRRFLGSLRLPDGGAGSFSGGGVSVGSVPGGGVSGGGAFEVGGGEVPAGAGGEVPALEMSPTGALDVGGESLVLGAPAEAPGAAMLSLPDAAEGFSSLPAAEFSQMWRSLHDVAARPRLAWSPERGVTLSPGPVSPPEVRMLCDAANERGGVDVKGYREAALFRAAHVASSEEYAGLEAGELKSRLMEELFVPGLGEELFPDAAEPELAMRSMLQRTIDAAFSLRDGSVEARVNEAFRPATDGSLAHRLPSKADIMHAEGRLWMPESVSSLLLAGVKEVYRARAAEAVYDYRVKNGGDGDSAVHWAEEQELIQDTFRQVPFHEALRIAKTKENWRRGRVEFLKKKAASMRRAMEATDPALQKAIGRKGRERSRPAAFRGEATEGAGGTQKGARRWPVLRRGARSLPAVMSCPVSLEDDGEEEPTLTMPAGLYARLRADLGLGEEEEALVSLKGDEGLFPVRPAAVSGISMNAALLQSVFGGRDLTAAELARVVNGREELELRFKVV